MAEAKKWSPKEKNGRLTAHTRQDMPKSDFALPGKGDGPKGAGAGSYPIPDEKHARMALAMVAKYGSAEEKARVRAAVHKKFPEIDKKKHSPIHDHPRSPK